MSFHHNTTLLFLFSKLSMSFFKSFLITMAVVAVLLVTPSLGHRSDPPSAQPPLHNNVDAPILAHKGHHLHQEETSSGSSSRGVSHTQGAPSKASSY